MEVSLMASRLYSTTRPLYTQVARLLTRLGRTPYPRAVSGASSTRKRSSCGRNTSP